MAEDTARVVDRIVKGLTQNPAYLLMFGVCLLVFGIGTTAGVGGLLASNSPIAWGGLVIAGLAICATAIVVVKLETIGSALPVGAVGDRELEPIFKAVHENVRDALKVQHPVFHDWLKKECSLFRAHTKQWGHGEIELNGRQYNELLVDTYARAEREIFATAPEDYSSVWRAQIGKAILSAHRKGKAKVQRVFIFDSLDRITEEHVHAMKEQADCDEKIDVYVYGIREHESYDIPRSVSINFALADGGDVIIATERTAADSRKGTFYFKDENQRFMYQEVIANIREGWKPLTEFLTERSEAAKPSMHSPASESD